nr:MAG TPA: hypothetical protein [Caudoviricetes sp.]
MAAEESIRQRVLFCLSGWQDRKPNNQTIMWE